MNMVRDPAYILFNVHETLVFGEATVLTISEISGYHSGEIWREASDSR